MRFIEQLEIFDSIVSHLLIFIVGLLMAAFVLLVAGSVIWGAIFG